MPDSENHSAGDQQLAEYPHQANDIVTAVALAGHFGAHPEAYHPALHEPIRRVLGEHATVSAAQEQEAPYGILPSGEPRTRPPLTDSQYGELGDYHLYVMGGADDELYEAGQPFPELPVPLDTELFYDLRQRDADSGKLDRSYPGYTDTEMFFELAQGHITPRQQQDVADCLQAGQHTADRGILVQWLPVLPNARFDAQATAGLIDAATSKDGPNLIRHINQLESVDYTKLALKVVSANTDVERDSIDGWWDDDTVDSFFRNHTDQIDTEKVGWAMLRGGGQAVAFLARHMDSFRGVDEESVVEALVDEFGNGRILLSNLFRFHDVPDNILRGLSANVGFEVRNFPHGPNEALQNRWFAEHAFVYLDGGFNKNLIGKVIRQRLEPRFTGSGDARVVLPPLEKDLHDATQWLSEFKMPEEAYDIDYILKHRKDPDFDPDMVQPHKLRDTELEATLIGSILCASPELRARLNLTDNPEKIMQMFEDPTACVCFYALVAKDENGVPYYKQPDLSRQNEPIYDHEDDAWPVQYVDSIDTARLEDIIRKLGPEYFEVFTGRAAGKWDVTTSRELFTDEDFEVGISTEISKFVNQVIYTPEGRRLSDPFTTQLKAGPIGKQMGELKELGLRRKRYADDAAAWLVRHARTKHETLTQVWHDRPLALAYGVKRDEEGRVVSELKDNATEIRSWQHTEGLRVLLNTPESQNILADAGLQPSALLGPEGEAWRTELTRVLGAEDARDAFVQHHTWTKDRTWREKLLGQSKTEVVTGGGGSGVQWQFEVLGPDDPRGFTIGNDTGCCMTITGESSSCIEAGYSRENAGFVALYGADSKLHAQSFWYVNPSRPDVLVLDNIEANQGRDFGKITDAYKEALRKVITEHNASHPDRPIKRVHVGEGYTDVAIDHLPKVQNPVPPLNRDIYTDAERQRLLLEV